MGPVRNAGHNKWYLQPHDTMAYSSGALSSLAPSWQNLFPQGPENWGVKRNSPDFFHTTSATMSTTELTRPWRKLLNQRLIKATQYQNTNKQHKPHISDWVYQYSTSNRGVHRVRERGAEHLQGLKRTKKLQYKLHRQRINWDKNCILMSLFCNRITFSTISLKWLLVATLIFWFWNFCGSP